MAGGLVAVVLWGLAPVATRAVVTHLAPMPLLVLRLTVAALVLLPWAVPVFRRLRLRSLGRLIAAGALGLIGYNLSVTVGLQWLPAATAGLLLATEPVWVMILGKVFLAERAGARAWLGSAVALGGVAVLAGPAALTGAGGPRALAGAGLMLAGTLAFGAYTIVLRPLSQAYGAVPATAASTVVGAIPYLAFAGTLTAPTLAHLSAPTWGEVVFLALGSTVAGMLLWNRAVLSGGTTRVSLLLYLEPAVSVAGAIVLLGEHLTLTTVAGGALILAGVAASSIARPRQPGRRQPPAAAVRTRGAVHVARRIARIPRDPGCEATMTTTTTCANLDLLRARMATAIGGRMAGHIGRLGWSPGQLAGLQRARLRALLAHAIDRSPFHAARLAGIDAARFELTDVAQLPIMTKTQMMNGFNEVVTDRRLTRELVDQHIAASSAEPSQLHPAADPLRAH